MWAGAGKIKFGIYACSPEDSSFKAVFTDMKLTECQWKAHDGQKPDEMQQNVFDIKNQYENSYVCRICERMNDCKQFIKTSFIVFDCDFRNYFLISCRNDAAIMFVLGNINSNKVH